MDDAAPPLAPAVTSPAPVALLERIATVDVVRGLAVLGILVMNVVEFGQPNDAYDNPAYAGGSTGFNLATWFVQVALFDGKMRALFSMLFGAGMVLIAERMEKKGQAASTADLLLRRCLWLVPFGIVHRFGLQWTGDILYQYGLLGVIAVAFRKLRAHTLIALAIVALAMFIPIGLFHHSQIVKVRAQATEAAQLVADHKEVPAPLADAQKRWTARVQLIPPKPEAVQKEVDAMHRGYGEIFWHRWEYHHTFQSVYLYIYFVWDVLGMVLLGMGLMKLGFFSGTCSPRVYRTLLATGIAAALLWSVWAALWQQTGFSATALELNLVKQTTYGFSRGLVGLGWASALILLYNANRLRWLTTALGRVGRMAFSNYILQTLCCTFLFLGYGLGHFGDFSRSQLMLVMLAVSLVQVAFSFAWLWLFRFGPLEWLWRSLTYWRWQPFLRRGEAETA